MLYVLLIINFKDHAIKNLILMSRLLDSQEINVFKIQIVYLDLGNVEAIKYVKVLQNMGHVKEVLIAYSDISVAMDIVSQFFQKVLFAFLAMIVGEKLFVFFRTVLIHLEHVLEYCL